MKRNILLIISALAVSAFATDNNAINEARTAALGSASVALISADNPGANSMSPENNISVNYANPFGVQELSTVAGHLFFANKLLDAGLVVSSFGYEKYNETRLAANFSKKLSSRLSMGVRLNYYSLLMSVTEDRKSMMSADVGFLVKPLSNLFIGFAAEHFIRTAYTTARGEFELPLTLRVGANYQVSTDFLMVGEVEKDVIDDTLLKIGCEYTPLKEAALRVGLMNNPFRPTFGVGYCPGRFVFDVASVYHTVLGFHTQFSMGYKF
ncbi:MAG: hypothetical protein WCJ03_06360 [Bacteroidales bacterium]